MHAVIQISTPYSPHCVLHRRSTPALGPSGTMCGMATHHWVAICGPRKIHFF